MVRFKNRYLLVDLAWKQEEGSGREGAGEGTGEMELTATDIFGAVRDQILVCFGDAGWGACMSSLQAKYYDPSTHLAIIRISREQSKRVWAAITTIRQIQGNEVACRMIKMCGTVRTCKVVAASVEKGRFQVKRKACTLLQRKALDAAEDAALLLLEKLDN